MGDLKGDDSQVDMWASRQATNVDISKQVKKTSIANKEMDGREIERH